jgi:hypothetical protein
MLTGIARSLKLMKKTSPGETPALRSMSKSLAHDAIARDLAARADLHSADVAAAASRVSATERRSGMSSAGGCETDGTLAGESHETPVRREGTSLMAP